jgi:hypothetical protein
MKSLSSHQPSFPASLDAFPTFSIMCDCEQKRWFMQEAEQRKKKRFQPLFDIRHWG